MFLPPFSQEIIDCSRFCETNINNYKFFFSFIVFIRESYEIFNSCFFGFQGIPFYLFIIFFATFNILLLRNRWFKLWKIVCAFLEARTTTTFDLLSRKKRKERDKKNVCENPAYPMTKAMTDKFLKVPLHSLLKNRYGSYATRKK